MPLQLSYASLICLKCAIYFKAKHPKPRKPRQSGNEKANKKVGKGNCGWVSVLLYTKRILVCWLALNVLVNGRNLKENLSVILQHFNRPKHNYLQMKDMLSV